MKLLLLLLALLAPAAPKKGTCYSAWTETGTHLIMSDNGTPNDPDDDFVADWETNREYTITIND